MISRILERLEAEKQRLRKLRNTCIALSDKEVCDIEDKAYNFCKEIVQEVAKEYGQPPVVKEILTSEKDGGWIPCNERLPEQRGYYMTCDICGNIHIFFHDKELKYPFGISPSNSRFYQPIAWCELPQPYEPNNAPVQKGEQKKAFNEEKCRTARHFAACADSYCSDDCNMQCPHQEGE